jgi:hypothetical protein
MSISYGDKSEASLRTLVAAVEHELASGSPSDTLKTAWKDLVATLALGAAPLKRACPSCGEIGMRAATRCSRCWTALVPPTA